MCRHCLTATHSSSGFRTVSQPTLNFFSYSDCTFIICFDFSNVLLTMASNALGFFFPKMKRLKSEIFLSNNNAANCKKLVNITDNQENSNPNPIGITFRMTIKK